VIPNFGYLKQQKSHQESQENTTTLGAQEEIKENGEENKEEGMKYENSEFHEVEGE
jgi:hypothetical protein